MHRRKLSARDVPAAYAAALFALYLFLPSGGYSRIMEGKFHGYLLLTVPFALWGLYRAVRTRWRPDAADGAALGYLGWAALSALCSPYGSVTLLGGTRHEGLLTLALYAISFMLLRRLDRARPLLAFTAVSATLCALLTILQLAGSNPFSLYPEGLGYHDGDVAYPGFYAGTSGNADFTAYLLAIAVCVLAAAWARERSRRANRLLLPLGLALYALVRLGVAGAMAGLAGAALLSPMLLGRSRRTRLCALLAATAAMAAVYALPFESGTLWEMQQLLHGKIDGGFGSGRLGIWLALIPLVAERPLLGGGPDTLWLRGLEPFYWYRDGEAYASAITAAHNEYLGTLVNTGFPSLLCYLALQAAALRRARRHADDPLCAICAPALVCAMVQSLFSVSTCITAPFVWLLLALLLPAGE